MSCDMIGNENGNLEKPVEKERVSKTIVKDVVLEIVANALGITDDKAMTKIPADQFKRAPVKEKSLARIRGTGDQRSKDTLEAQELVIHDARARKKNRLPDLARNSKQVFAKMIACENKADPRKEKKNRKKLFENELFKSKYKEHPEEVSLSKENRNENITTRHPSEKPMVDLNLDTTKEDLVERKRMTFPRATGSRTKTAFMAKCRTLKKEAINFNKKKWDVGGRIINFFRKKEDSHNGEGSKRQQTVKFRDMEESGDKYEGQ
ncbi:uncharacterized protein [Euwallacea fornicatus]|uniref:uncharacterized protein isoform X2 n=1 Tax=Euwallacea fornicatus TaxID=995702 RepID=UPI00338E0E79